MFARKPCCAPHPSTDQSLIGSDRSVGARSRRRLSAAICFDLSTPAMEGGRCIPYEVRLVDGASVDLGGLPVSITWKAFVYSGGIITWELRRVALDYLMGARQHLELSKIVKGMQAPWGALLQSLGTNFSDAVIPSLKSAASRDEVAIRNPLVRSEWTVTTKGLLAFLIIIAGASHSRERRVRGDALLRAWAGRLVPPGDVCPESLQIIASQSASACSFDPDSRGICSHMATALPAEGLADGTMVWRYLSCCLVRLYGMSKDCEAALASFISIVGTLADKIDKLVVDMPAPQDILKMELLRGTKRKLRVDEEYKLEVGNGLVCKKRVHSGAQYVKATGDFGESAPRKWEGTTMLQYRAAAMDTCTKGQVVWVASDGSRVGQPAEETLVSLLWDQASDRGIVLPPQASAGVVA